MTDESGVNPRCLYLAKAMEIAKDIERKDSLRLPPFGYGALTILMCVILAFTIDITQAQEPEPEYVLYLPILHYSPPWPYNVKAVDLVLQPSDMPSGYELIESISGPPSEVRGVDEYLNYYKQQETGGPFAMFNLVIVFVSPESARDEFLRLKQSMSSLEDFKCFRALSTIGDEVFAIETDPYDLTIYFIVFRKGNLVSQVTIWGDTGDVQFDDDAVWFARKSLNRINDQIQCCNTMELGTPPERKSGVTLVHTQQGQMQEFTKAIQVNRMK